jgi:hypothetical protein
MTRIFPALLLLTITFTGFGQNSKPIDSLSIKFLFPFSQVYDSSQLTVKVVYKNNSDRYLSIYKELEEGNWQDRFFNMNIEMEKLDKGKYTYHFMRCYISVHEYSMVDSLRHFDLPKKQLAPYASDTLGLNILTVSRSFWPGKYRFKAHLRVKTIRDDREYNDPNFETAPPYDTIEYVSSEWIYFTVKNFMQMRWTNLQ